MLPDPLLILPLHWATRIYWPRWWAAVAFLVLGPLLLVGPYVAAKGGIGTKPSIARLLGTAPRSAPSALERERPLPPGQSTLETYRQATQRMVKVLRASVTTPLLPLVVLGLVTVRPWSRFSKSFAIGQRRPRWRTSTFSIRAPSMAGARPRRTVSTSGSSGMVNLFLNDT